MVGKPCTFELEETVASIGKSFGNVFINGENLAASIVAAGWAKVRRPLLYCIRMPVRAKGVVFWASTDSVWRGDDVEISSAGQGGERQQRGA